MPLELYVENSGQATPIFLRNEEFAATGLREISDWLVACPDDHIGDQAILTALKREGFLGDTKPPANMALQEINF